MTHTIHDSPTSLQHSAVRTPPRTVTGRLGDARQDSGDVIEMSQWLRPERGWGLTNCIRRSCARFYTAKPRASLTLSGAVRSGFLFRRYVEFIQHLTLGRCRNVLTKMYRRACSSTDYAASFGTTNESMSTGWKQAGSSCAPSFCNRASGAIGAGSSVG